MMRLYIGNRNYSSWSLRPWLGLRQAGIAFETERIALFEPGYKARILRHSPAGKVPVLVDGDVVVWDSLAIGEYAAEKFPEAGIWPADRVTRARARSVSAEMHSGFAALRSAMPMNLRAHLPGKGRADAVGADIDRICALWGDALDRSGGPFLFGAFCYADAMYAPVATRFVTYGIELPAHAQCYVDAIESLPSMRDWRAAAHAETEVIAAYELAR